MTEGQRIRVMVVDDHAVVRSGIEYSLLALSDIEMVASVSSGEEALRQCQDVQPDVVLMDMMMPGMDGAETTRALLERCPEVRVVALTSFREGNVVQKALQAGATSYLLKDVGMDEMADVIRSTYAGRGTLAPEAARALADAASLTQGLGQDLSGREREVLRLIVEGKSNVDIADCLSISLSTARFHVSTILSKLGAANRAEAAALAIKLDLV